MINAIFCQIAALMLQRVKKKRLMADLIRKYSKLNLSDAQYAFVLDKDGALVTNSNPDTAVKVVVEDIVLTEPKQFLPWVFTNPILIDPKVSVIGVVDSVTFDSNLFMVIGIVPKTFVPEV